MTTAARRLYALLTEDRKTRHKVLVIRHFLGGKFNPINLRDFVWGIWPSGETPNGDSLAKIDWSELAAFLNEL
jgi:hypothetical protein